jgi:hypothetical protein
MVIIDAELDKSPTPDLVSELAELRIRNLLCFSELETLNNTGKFRGKHPLIKFFSVRQLLAKLRKDDPEQFLYDFSTCRDNVKRYSSFLKRKEITDDQRKKWEKQHDKHSSRLELMKEVMSNES